MPVVCNLIDSSARTRLVEKASEFFGAMDIIVNNAAGSKMCLPSETTVQERSWMYDINVNALAMTMALKVTSLDGQKVLGDAFLPVNLDTTT